MGTVEHLRFRRPVEIDDEIQRDRWESRHTTETGLNAFVQKRAERELFGTENKLWPAEVRNSVPADPFGPMEGPYAGDPMAAAEQALYGEM